MKTEPARPSGGKAPPTSPLPAPAQALQWIGRPYEFLRDCAKQHGDVFTLNFGAQGTYTVFSHPDAIREIFTADPAVLHVGPGNGVLEPLVGSSSLLLAEEKQHARHRRLLMPAFQQKAIAGYAHTIREVLLAATESWAVGCEFVAQDFLQDVSIDVILRAVFGLRASSACAELKAELVGLLNDKRLGLGLLGQLRESTPLPALAEWRARLERLRQLTVSTIVERRSAADRDSASDILAMLLGSTNEDGSRRPDVEIRDELLTLVVTGHETTATALAWGLYWLATHADVGERLRLEVAALGSTPDPKLYLQLEYLDATCKEILRIYPIVPAVFRQVVRPFGVAGYNFAPGTVLSPSIYLTHHREDLYPEGDRFDPNRFLQRTYSPYEYLPFGGGARRCIGMHLALCEMKIIIATLLRCFELELAPGQTVMPTRRMVAIAPSGGPRLLVTGVRV